MAAGLNLNNIQSVIRAYSPVQVAWRCASANGADFRDALKTSSRRKGFQLRLPPQSLKFSNHAIDRMRMRGISYLIRRKWNRFSLLFQKPSKRRE